MKYQPNQIPPIDALGMFSINVHSDKGEVYFSLFTRKWHKEIKNINILKDSHPVVEIQWWEYPQPHDVSIYFEKPKGL